MPFHLPSLLGGKRKGKPHSSDLEANLKWCQWDIFEHFHKVKETHIELLPL